MPIRYINPLPNPVRQGINVEYFDRKALENQARHDKARALWTEETKLLANQTFLDQQAREQFMQERDQMFEGAVDANAGNLSKGFHDILGAVEKSALHPYHNLSKRKVEQSKIQQALKEKHGERFISQGQGLDDPLYQDGQWADPSSIEAGGLGATDYKAFAKDMLSNLKAKVTSGQLDLSQSENEYYLKSLIYGNKVLTKEDILNLSSDPLIQQVFRTSTTAGLDTREISPGKTYADMFGSNEELANFIAGANLDKIQDDSTQKFQFQTDQGRLQQDRMNLAAYKSKLKKKEIDYENQYTFNPTLTAKEGVGTLNQQNYKQQQEKYNEAVANKEKAIEDSNQLAFGIFSKNNPNLEFDPKIDYAAALNATRNEHGELNLDQLLDKSTLKEEEKNAFETYFNETENQKNHWTNLADESSFGKSTQQLNDQIWNELTSEEQGRYGTKEDFEEISNRDKGVLNILLEEVGLVKPDVIQKLEKDKDTEKSWWDYLEFVIPGVQGWDVAVEGLRQIKTYRNYTPEEKQEVKDWMLNIGQSIAQKGVFAYDQYQNAEQLITTIQDEAIIQKKKNQLLDSDSIKMGVITSRLSDNPKSAYNYIPKLYDKATKGNPKLLGGFKTNDENQLSALQVPLDDDSERKIADIIDDPNTKVTFKMAGATGVSGGGANLIANITYGTGKNAGTKTLSVNVGDSNINAFVGPLVGEVTSKVNAQAGTYDSKSQDIERQFTDIGMIKGGSDINQKANLLKNTNVNKWFWIPVSIDGDPKNKVYFRMGKTIISDPLKPDRTKDSYYLSRVDINGNQEFLGAYDDQNDMIVDASNTFGKVYSMNSAGAKIPSWKYNDKYVRKLKK